MPPDAVGIEDLMNTRERVLGEDISYDLRIAGDDRPKPAYDKVFDGPIVHRSGFNAPEKRRSAFVIADSPVGQKFAESLGSVTGFQELGLKLLH